ncbi:PucR family transcriptional regulator [Actinocrispum wychmicini]|nr:PucR family transcriptional regulator [Actinocrispum wychmicini]
MNNVDALLPRIDEIATAMIARCAVEIPAYRLLPASVLEGDLVANAKGVFELFLTTVAEGRPPTEQELAPPIAWGAERARDGLPLEAVLQTYPTGAGVAWAMAAEGDVDLEVLGTRMIGFLGAVIPRVAAAYLRERDDLDWEQREDRQNLAAGLLAGRPARRAASRKLADSYDVVVFHLPALPADSGPRAATNLFRQIRSDMDSQPDVLVTFKDDGGIVLVPTGGADRLMSRIDAVTGHRCVAAAATAATHADIPAAHNEAAEVLALAENLSRPPGLYRLADLAIEYQIAQPGPARELLARVLAPLAGHPHLIDTLRGFVLSGYHRGDAAAALNIHRNTLTYRLGRIQILTGHDATQPADARHLAAAITAYDIIRHASR